MLEEICTKIGADVRDQWSRIRPTDELIVEIDDDGPNFNGTPPRLVFVPGAETIGPSDAASHDRPPGALLQSQPRQLFTRKSEVVVHCWGETRTLTEELAHATIRASYGLLFGSFGCPSGRWRPRSTTKLGHLYLLNVFFLIPVPREAEPSRPLTEMPITTEFVASI